MTATSLLGSDPVLVENDSFILLLNDGTDPIHRTFHQLPEGDVIPSTMDSRYVFQRSIDLENWHDLLEFLGNGELMEFQHPMDETREFFRFSILPYSNGGSGTSERSVR